MGAKDLATSKAKILAYKLGNPLTYTPNPKRNFPVVSRYVAAPVIPKPRQTVFYNWKPADPKPMHVPTPVTTKRPNVKTVTVSAALQCPSCEGSKSRHAKQCRSCSYASKTKYEGTLQERKTQAMRAFRSKQ